MTEMPGAAAEIIMQMKYAFEVADGIRKVKKNDLTAIRTLRPQEFTRDVDVFNKHDSQQKTLLLRTLDERDSKREILLSKYTT